MSKETPLDTDLRLGSLPLVGRAAEIAHIERAVTALAAGTGGVLVVEAARGLGKSRLVAHAAAMAARSELTTAVRRATELDHMTPMSTLHRTLSGCRAIAPRLGRLVEDEEERPLPDRLAERLAALTPERGLVVGIDDAHLADEMTATVLRTVVPALKAEPVLWILSTRPGPDPSSTPAAYEAVEALVAGGATCLQPGPLADDDVARLCASVLGAPVSPEVMELAARAGGNPFLCKELLTSFKDTGRLKVAGGVPHVAGGLDGRDGPELPGRLLAAVNGWLGGLSDPASRLLEAGAILGRPFTVHEVVGLIGRSAVDLVPAATEAVTAGILTGTGSELDFQHGLIRDAVYARLSEPVRLALHREAAVVVEAEGRDLGEITEHLLRSRHPADARVTGVLKDAVREQAAHSPGDAADLALRLLDQLDEQDHATTEITVEAIRLLALSGRARQAKDLAERALHTAPDVETETTLLDAYSEVLRLLGDDAAVVEHTRRMLARPEVTEAARAELLALQAYGSAQAGDAETAEQVGLEAVELAELSGRRGALVLGSIARSVAARSRNDFGLSLEMARRAVETADGAGPGAPRQHHPRLWLIPSLIVLDRFDEADEVLRHCRNEAATYGTDWSTPLWYSHSAHLHLTVGRFEEAAEDALAGLRLAEESSSDALAVPLLASLSESQVRRDDLKAARASLRRAQRLSRWPGETRRGHLAWRRLLIQLAAGQDREALRTARGICVASPIRDTLVASCPLVASTLVRMMVANDDAPRARSMADSVRAISAANPGVRSLAAAAAHTDGLISDDPARLATAVELYRWTPLTPVRASALEDAGRAELRRGDREHAIELLEEARETWYACRAVRDVARVGRLLKPEADGTGLPGPPAASPSAAPRARVEVEQAPELDLLTRSEMRVVRLVAQGLTNREIAARLSVSPHTVDSHLRRSFRKFDVTNRVELTRKVLAAINDTGDADDTGGGPQAGAND
ncbi:LuxR C-terminal-related transcriptional regulator [Spirillospora sp. NPDC047279]|uniref:ATP-binding protein n=1 Tax=Spirillospora sp. NPDC047279 TaxID=3155478 RepID=UPI0033CE7BA3